MSLSPQQQIVVAQELQDGVTIANLYSTLYTLEFTEGVISGSDLSTDLNTDFASLAAYDAELAAQLNGTAQFQTITFTFVSPVGAICYLRGTRIRTPDGDVRIEDLKVGDTVVTLGQGTQPIKWIGHRRIDLTLHPRPERAAPIRIRRDAFAEGVPSRDLLVSPDHGIYINGVLVCARTLVNGATILHERGMTDLEYFHIELDQHAIVFAEGLTSESYLDTGNRGFFANSGDPMILHPDLTGETGQALREAASCAPFVDDPAAVEPIWQNLADRACSLGATRRTLQTTDDPNLAVIANGRVLQPVQQSDGIYNFCLPSGTTSLRLVSRATAPSALRPWVSDDRRLGVAVSRIVIRDLIDQKPVPVDHPALADGWWDAETDGTTTWRWTNGNAELPLAATGQACLLEVRVQAGGVYLLDTAETAELLVA